MSVIESQSANEPDQCELEKHLVWAAEEGDLDEVKRLVKAGADVMGRYLPPLGTSLGHKITILKLFDNRHRALLRYRYHLGERDLGYSVNQIGWTPLQAASARGHLSTVEFLIQSGGDVNDPVGTAQIGRTALQWAVETGKLELIRLLIEKGADLNAMPAFNSGMTALQRAAELGYEKVVDLLLESGADINQNPARNCGRTALQAACAHGQLPLVEYLLNRGARINGPPSESNGVTPLSAAVGGGHLDIVKFLIERRVDVNEEALNTEDRTALQVAVRKGNFEMVRVLRSHGARINADIDLYGGMTAIQSAINQGNKDAADILFTAVECEYPQTVRRYRGWTALQAAAKQGLLDIVKLLVSSGVSVKQDPSPGGRTALQAAAGKGHMEVARFLVENGADPNEKPSEDGLTALQAAAGGGHEEMVRWLVSDLRADVNAPASMPTGRTALQAAAEHGSIEIVRFLLDKGAEVDAKASDGINGFMALRAAAQEGHIAIVKLLHQARASVERPFKCYPHSPQTPLQAAATRGHIDIAEYLVASGADVNAGPAEWYGRTALQAAAEGGHCEMVRWLLTKNADIHANGAIGYGVTAIYAAVAGGDKQIVSMLLSAGASKSLAFYYAAGEGDLCLVKMLHLQGVNADGMIGGKKVDNSTHGTPLQVAVVRQAYDVIRFLLANKARINAPVSETDGRTALYVAAELGYLQIVQYLISMKADMNELAPDMSGKTLFQVALENRHDKVALLLLNAGATSSDTIGADGQSALHRTCDDRSFHLFRTLAKECTDETLNLTNFSGSTALHLAVEGGHQKVIRYLLDIPHLDKDICDIQRNTPLKIAILKNDRPTAKLLLNKGARTDGLTLEELRVVGDILMDKPVGPSIQNDDSHFILLCHNRTTGTHVERTPEMIIFNTEEWDLYDWEGNAKTSILFPSPSTEINHPKQYSTFVNPAHFLCGTKYPNTTQGESLILWAWSMFSKTYVRANSTTIHDFRNNFPTSQDMKLSVLLVPYIRFEWPAIFVRAPHLKPGYTKTAHSGQTQNTITLDVTGEAIDVSGFTSDKRRIEISWVMAKRNLNNKEVASPMQAIHFRGNLDLKVPSIPDSAAEFVLWFLEDVCGHWTQLLDKAGQQLVKIRDFQLAAEGRDKDVIKSLLMHSREWNKLRETLRKHVEQASELLKQFKESEVLFGELITPLKKRMRKDQSNKEHNTKALHGTSLPPDTLSQNDNPVAMGNPRPAEPPLPEPGMLARRATQGITNNAKNIQHVVLAPPADQARQIRDIGGLPKIRDLEKRVALMQELGKRLSGLDQETKDMIELEFNLVSIHEARESVKMSQSMKRLSWITFIFLPLMFVAGLFGMNVDIVASNPSWKWYPISAAPFMAFVMLAWLLFKCRPISKTLKWYRAGGASYVIRNPGSLFGKMRRRSRDEEICEERKDHND